MRVLYDFETSKKGEITLLTGDIIQITEVVDDNWLRGRLSGTEGIFPSNFVESITLPSVQPGQKIFAGVDEFRAGQDGDLGINRGEWQTWASCSQHPCYSLSFYVFNSPCVCYLLKYFIYFAPLNLILGTHAVYWIHNFFKLLILQYTMVGQMD